MAETQFFELGKFSFSSGAQLNSARLAFETFGKLNARKDNAILVFHALSGSQHIAGLNDSHKNEFWTSECHSGWWNDFVGEGKIIDTNNFFVVCANFLGGCYGSTGPASINPETGKRFASWFPDVSLKDIAVSQAKLLGFLGIEKLHSVIGGSIGGMAAQEFLLSFLDRAESAVLIGTSPYLSKLNCVMNLEQILAIENDPNFNNGEYYDGEPPKKGLMLARMIAHKTYVDIDQIEKRAKAEIRKAKNGLNYDLRHSLESYMMRQGEKFVERFDANTYLKLLTAMQSYDLARDYGKGELSNVFAGVDARVQVFSINTDYCCFPEEQQALKAALEHNGVKLDYRIVDSAKGHDSFLIEPEKYVSLKWFLENSFY